MADLDQERQRRAGAPIADYSPSRPLAPHMHALGDGIYVRGRRQPPHPVHSVGWAASEAWARRIWLRESQVASGGGAELPDQLARILPAAIYGEILASESVRPDRRQATLRTATYDANNGEFICSEINGTDGVTYYFGTPNPEDGDEPVAVEFKLPD